MRGALFALLAFALFSTHDVVIKFLGGSISSPQIIFFSVLFSFPLIIFMLIRDADGGSLRPVHPWWTAGLIGAAPDIARSRWQRTQLQA